MLTWEEDVEVHALIRRGWTISAIARHLGRTRNTIRAYARGDRQPGERLRSAPDAFEPFVAYVRQRLADDPHVWASARLDEVRRLGYDGRYSTFTENVRKRDLRPHCEPCAGVRGRPTIEIEHPPGEEVQWDFNGVLRARGRRAGPRSRLSGLSLGRRRPGEPLSAGRPAPPRSG